MYNVFVDYHYKGWYYYKKIMETEELICNMT